MGRGEASIEEKEKEGSGIDVKGRESRFEKQQRGSHALLHGVFFVRRASSLVWNSCLFLVLFSSLV